MKIKKYVSILFFSDTGKRTFKVNISRSLIWMLVCCFLLVIGGIGWLYYTSIYLNRQLTDFAKLEAKQKQDQQVIAQFNERQMDLKIHEDILNKLQRDLEHELTKKTDTPLQGVVSIKKLTKKERQLKTVLDAIPEHMPYVPAAKVSQFLSFLANPSFSMRSSVVGWPLPISLNGIVRIEKHSDTNTNYVSISTVEGTPVYSPEKGLVNFVSTNQNGEIDIYYNNGFYVKYQNINHIRVQRGDIVKKGELIAYVAPVPRKITSYLAYTESFYNVPFEHYFKSD